MHKLLGVSLALSAALLTVPAAHAQDAKAKAQRTADKPPLAAQAPAAGAPAAAATAPAGPAAAPAKDLFPAAYFDIMLKERQSMGQQDSPQVREQIREELNTRELIVREARKKGMDKDAALKAKMDLSAQTVLVREYIQDYLKAHPVTDEVLRKEYETIKGQLGDKEYKARHILVDKEEDAKDIIGSLQKGEKFEKLAERSKDTGSKANGGDLGWASPANFVKPFSDAMTGLQKGKFTPQPVRTQFGWHVIQLEDVRAAQIPSFDEVKGQLLQRLQPQVVDSHLRELRAKANVK